MTASLTWPQVHAWRLGQHHLQQRAESQQLLEVVSRIGGVQAQLMPAAELALWARVDGLAAAGVADALWSERSLVKTWVMRGTLHLIAAGDLPLYVAARAAYTINRPPSYYRYHGVTPDELDAIIEGIPQVLSDVPLTREQLAEGVAERAGNPNLREVLLSGWGALLKPSAFRGDICFGPNQGQNVTFVLPGCWIGEWESPEPQRAIQEVARRYLRAFGPATTDDFARWFGLTAGQAKKVFRSLGDEITAVDVEAWPAWALAAILESLPDLDVTPVVRLLPQFDAYVLGVARDCEPILQAEYKSRVYRPQGWISAVVLVNGRMKGVWTYDRHGDQITLRVEMFEPPTAATIRGVEAEVERLGDFLNTRVGLVWEP